MRQQDSKNEKIKMFTLADELTTINQVKDYLCDLGPGHCNQCESACAYGKRFLQLARSAGLTPQDIADYRQRRLEKNREKWARQREKKKARQALLTP